MRNKNFRHLDIFNPNTAHHKKITVIGAGATGSFLIHALTKMGLTDITVYDMDTLESHNMGLQNFKHTQLKHNKATALKQNIKEYENIDINAIPQECKKLEGITQHDIIVFALDNYNARKQILNSIKDTGCILIDIRVGNESIHIQTINTSNPEHLRLYKKTIFNDDTSNNLNCTARNIIYNVYYTTAITTNIIKRILLNQPVPTNHLFSFTTQNNNPRQIIEPTHKVIT